MNYYDKINWKNRSEGKTTKISAERLNHMDNQIFNNANAIGNVEKIADIGDGTLCGAAETLKETAEKLTQSLSDVNSNLSKIQKGVTTTVGISSSADIKLAVPYSNTNYTVIATVEFKDTASKFCVANVYKRNNDTFTIYTFDSVTNTPVGGITVSWVAIGN